MSPQLVIVALIIFALIFIFLIVLQPNDEKTRKIFREQISQSSGEFDEAARKSLETLNKVRDRMPVDDYNHARVIEQNMLGGNVRRANAPVLRTLINRYSRVVQGVRDELAPRRSALAQRFGTNDLTDDIVGAGLNYAMNAANDAANAAAETRNQDIFTRMFLLDATEQFGDRLHEVPPDVLAEVGNDTLNEFRTVLDTLVPAARDNIIKTRRVTAAHTSNTKGEFAEKYINEAKKMVNNPQSVHDSVANSDLRETVRKLVDDIGGFENIGDVQRDEIIAYINNYYTSNDDIRAKKSLKAKQALERIGSNTISTFTLDDKFPMTDGAILSLVWKRADHPENSVSSDDIRDAVVDALADCVENGNVVCVNGRCSKILSSLALIDFDKSISNVRTYDALKNEIMSGAHRVMNEEIARLKTSFDEAIRNVAKSYDDPSIDTDNSAETTVNTMLIAKMNEFIDSYSSKLTELQITELKKECAAALT